MNTESRRHQTGGSPVTAYQTPPAALSWPIEYINKKYSIHKAIIVWRPLDSNLLPIVSATVAAPSFAENSLVLTAASQMHRIQPTRITEMSNRIPIPTAEPIAMPVVCWGTSRYCGFIHATSLKSAMFQQRSSGSDQ